MPQRLAHAPRRLHDRAVLAIHRLRRQILARPGDGVPIQVGRRPKQIAARRGDRSLYATRDLQPKFLKQILSSIAGAVRAEVSEQWLAIFLEDSLKALMLHWANGGLYSRNPPDGQLP